MTSNVTEMLSNLLVSLILIVAAVIACIVIIKNGRKGCDIGTCSACPHAKNCSKKGK